MRAARNRAARKRGAPLPEQPRSAQEATAKMSDGWPFEESLDHIIDPSSWSVTTELNAALPQVAARMRELQVTREPSETELPLTLAALTRLIRQHWPTPAVESLAERDATSVTFRWLNFLFIIHNNLFVEQHRTTPEGAAIVSDLWPNTNVATRTLERILQRGLEGNPVKFPAVDEEGARALIDAQPDTPNLFWRGSRLGLGQIGLCARHARMWPQELGPLRLCLLTPQLLADLASSSAPTIQSAAREIYEWHANKRPRGCSGCHYESEYRNLSPFHGIDPVGPDLPSHGRDDGRGPLSRPAYGQPLVVLSDDPALLPFTCDRCGSVKPRLQGTPCEGCGRGVCLSCVGEDPKCPNCKLCALCGAEDGESHDQGLHDKYAPARRGEGDDY